MFNNSEQCCGIVKNTDKLCSVKCNNGYFYCQYHYKQKGDVDKFKKSVSNFVQWIKNENTKEQKILISKRMFDFCVYNKCLINTMQPLKNQLLKKIEEFSKTDKSFEYYLDEKIWENNNVQQKKVFIKLENPIVISTNDFITI